MQHLKAISFLKPFCLLLASVLPLFLQANPNEAVENYEVNLSTPYHTVLTHLHFLQNATYEPQKAAAPFLHPGTDSAQAREMSIMLKQAWDGRGHLVDMGALPRDAAYIDSVSQRNLFRPVPQTPGIFVERMPDGQWLYSLQSFEAIEDFHGEVFPYGAGVLMDLMPKTGSYRFIGLYLWQHIGILIIIMIAFLVHKLLTFTFNRLLYKGAHQLGYDQIVRPYLLPVARPLSLFVVFILVMILYPVLQLPVKVSFYLGYIFRAILPFFWDAGIL